jgi:hypothetical protein
MVKRNQRFFDSLFTIPYLPFTIHEERAEDMNPTLSCRMRIVLGCCSLVAVIVFIAPEARGQDYRLPPISTPPPPMKFVSRSERTQLSAARDAKARTRATIELAEARLSRAEQLTAVQQFEAATTELGIYQGLVEDALNYLDGADSKASRDTYKRLELALRAHCVRLEGIRRVTPSEYAVHVKAICECARNARAEALNGFYGDTVIRDAEPNAERASGGGSLKDSASGAAKKQ